MTDQLRNDNGYNLIPNFEVAGETSETERMARTCAAIAGEIALCFNMRSSEIGLDDLRCDPLVMLGARATIAYLELTGRLSPGALERQEDDSTAFNLIIDSTVKSYRDRINKNFRDAEYLRAFRDTYEAEPGAKFVYPTADTFGDYLSDVVRDYADIEFLDSDEEQVEEVYMNERDMFIDGLKQDDEIREQAERKLIQSKIAGWIKTMADDQEPATISIPAISQPDWSIIMSQVRNDRLYARIDRLSTAEGVEI